MCNAVTTLEPADLEMRVTVREDNNGWTLGYVLNSLKLDLFNVRIEGPRIRHPDAFRDRLFKTLELLHRDKDSHRAALSSKEVAQELEVLGQEFYDELFPPQLKSEYRRILRRAETLLLISDEPSIPWEMLKPFDDHGDPLDDDFLACRFQLTRWLAGGRAPTEGSGVTRLAGIDAGSVKGYPALGRAGDEMRFLRKLAGRHGIDDLSPDNVAHSAVIDLLGSRDLDLLHLVGHGKHDPEDPETSGFLLPDGRTLRPRDLRRVRRRLSKNRPVIFLNACQMGRQGWSLTNLGGWARHWIHDLGCRAFIAPQWTVGDDAAHVFATTLYESLERGETFGQAALAARQALPEGSPGRLAGVVYAHPNSRLRLGTSPSQAPKFKTRRARRRRAADTGDALENIRRHSEIAASDADFVGDEGERTQGRILLSQDLYVERNVEEGIRQRLLERQPGDAILVNGPAGRGKTSLLWRLYGWLRRLDDVPEVWLVKAGLLAFRPGVEGLLVDDFFSAIRQVPYRRSVGPVILIDTLDILLHQEAERDALLVCLHRLLDEGCVLVTTCRVQEAMTLPHRFRISNFLLERYQDDELEDAVRRHVARFYDRPESRESEEHVARLHSAVARGYPLREVCLNPLTLRMLFVLYAPHEVHNLEINVFELYREYWRKRVVRDERAGTATANQALSLEETASAVALTLLAEGRPELPQELVENGARRFKGSIEQIPQLVDRGVLQRSGQETLSFFHQTFLEHSVARGILGILGKNGLDWLGERFFESLGDLFVAPIFEQTLLLAESEIRPVRKRSEELQVELLQRKHPVARASGLYVYAHGSDPSPKLGGSVHNLLETGDTIAVNAYLDVAANISAARYASLFDEMDVIWQRNEWEEQLRLFDLLERVAPRQPEQVKERFERWLMLEWRDDVDKFRQIDEKFIRVVAAILPEDPAWAWRHLVGLYRTGLKGRRYRQMHVDLINLIADHAAHFDRSSIATRFQREAGHKELGKVFRPLAKAWGRLWRREWEARQYSVGDLMEELAAAPNLLHLYSWLEGMSELLLDADENDQHDLMKHLDQLDDKVLWLSWARIVLVRLLEGRGSLDDDCEEVPRGTRFLRARVRRMLGDAFDEDADEQTRGRARRRIEDLADGIRSVELPHGVFADLLSAKSLERTEPWFDRKGLLIFLVRAFAARVPEPCRILARMLARPEDFEPRLLGAVASQLSGQVERRPELCETAFDFSLMVGDPRPLLRLLGSLKLPVPDSIAGRKEEVQPFVERLLSERLHILTNQDLARRDAYEIWREAIRLKLTASPQLAEIKSRLATERDPRVRAAIARFLGSVTARAPYDTSAVLEILTRLRSEGEDVRENALLAILEVIAHMSEPESLVEEAYEAAMWQGTNPARLGRLSMVVNQLCRERTVALAFDLLRRTFEASEAQVPSARGKKAIANRFARVTLKAFRLGCIEDKRRLLALVPEVHYQFGRAIVGGAYGAAPEELRSELDRLFEDPRVSSAVKERMRRHKYHGERLTGGGRWEELYELAETVIQN